MDKLSRFVYEFAGFQLDVNQQLLVSPAGSSIPLPSRAFDVLRYLVERPGELVEKTALMKAVWPRAVVEENNLSQCIMAVRRALGDEVGERRFVLTVPGRGYKFVAPVQVLSDSPWQTPAIAVPPIEVPVASPGPAAEARPQRTRQRALMLLGAAAVLLAAGAWLYRAHSRTAVSPDRYEQLTDLPDAATAPALSPDGHLLAFIRDGTAFLSSGQVWIKRLPDGEPVQLTHESGLVFAPAFTPDGAHVVYSLVPGRKAGVPWESWRVPTSGGTPTLVLPNASGLSYIGPHEVMYSEFKTGVHLGIVTSRDDRSAHREIYLPSHERGMAHYSALSPDRKSVLVVEMGRDANFQRCRLLPFDGSSTGSAVGPPGACLSAAWSPDGRWMYMVIGAHGHSHLWRQPFPDGELQQITSGTSDEQNVVVAPDGASVLTSIGSEHATLWLHDAAGDRALTGEGTVWEPWISNDGKRLYFLSGTNLPNATPVLSRMDIGSGARETLLSGLPMDSYELSADERWLVFTTGARAVREIWVAPVDHHAAPRRLAQAADEIALDSAGHIYYRQLGERVNTLRRMNLDGSADQRLLAGPIVEFHAVSPDGKWVAVDLASGGDLPGLYLAPTNGSAPQQIFAGWRSSRWARDGKSLLVEVGEDPNSERAGRTIVLPLGADGLPPKAGAGEGTEAGTFPHAEQLLSVSADPAVYAYVKEVSERNIFRIPIQ